MKKAKKDIAHSEKVRAIRDRGDSNKKSKNFHDLEHLHAHTGKISKHVVLPNSRVRLMKVSGKPMPGQPPSLWLAKKEAEIEEMMLRGLNHPRDIARKIEGLSIAKINAICERIRERWTVTGTAYDVKQARGEALRYIGLLKERIWAVESKKDATNDHKIASLGLLARLFGTQLMLDGITATSIEDLSRATDETGEIMQRMKKQSNLAGVAGRLLDIVQLIRARKSQAVDTPADIPPPPKPGIKPSRKPAHVEKRKIRAR